MLKYDKMTLTSTDTAAPAKDETVDSISSNREDNHSNITTCHVECSSRCNETNYSHRFRDGDMPGALVPTARRPREQDRNRAGDQVRWAGENKSNSLAEAKSLDNGWELCVGRS